jgi:hypothetical protein
MVVMSTWCLAAGWADEPHRVSGRLYGRTARSSVLRVEKKFFSAALQIGL